MSPLSNVPVYVRLSDESERIFLGRFDRMDLEPLVKDFRQWSCVPEGDESTSEAVGNFFVSARDAGFEIIIGDFE